MIKQTLCYHNDYISQILIDEDLNCIYSVDTYRFNVWNFDEKDNKYLIKRSIIES